MLLSPPYQENLVALAVDESHSIVLNHGLTNSRNPFLKLEVYTALSQNL